MVAEPVQATVETLRSAYLRVSDFLVSSLDQLPDPTSIKNSRLFQYLSTSTQQPPGPNILANHTSLKQKYNDHKYEILSVLTVGLGVAGYYYYQKRLLAPYRNKQNKRRVPKLANGARRDVVLVVGSPTEPLTRLLAIDFEKRGFIVYLTILDDKDFKYIQSNGITDDINYLNLNESDNYDVAFRKFSHLLNVKVVPFQGAEPHVLKLSAVVFTPNLYFPLGPIENIPMSSWAKLQDKLGVYFRIIGSGLLDIVRDQHSKVIGIVPTIVSSLQMPYHAPETILQNSLKSLFAILAKELSPQGISVTQIRLGNLNLSNTRVLPASRATRVSNIVEAEVRSWSEEMRSVYGNDFQKAQARSSPIGSSLKTKGLRDLHHLLFDLIFSRSRNPLVVYYGTGARAYDRITSFLPVSFLELIS
ncbi:CIC11C00000003031 [Sungouiella intermedia]|uniref:CIC11C00000003031 n=1 Tax=Sungouiella intermedia TaxID=45354 RepID=A0A1L0D6R6_9ASCO|nr:CIC11C00000003031 [[Candida] intermedia]